MKVLVTGAGALLGQGIIRSLLESRLQVEVLAADPSEHAAGLYWVDGRFRIPMASDPSYLERMEELIERERPNAVMVGTDVELHALAAHRENLERDYGTHVIVSSPQVVAIADDKYETYRFLRDHGFDYPDSALPGEEDALVERVGYPLVVKPRVGARSVGVSVVRDREQLRVAVAASHRPVIQECVGTDQDEYTAGVLCFDGACCASIVMRRDLRDGNTYRAFVDHYPEFNAEVRRMGEALAPYGPANFQFRVAAGKIKVFEINGRFSGTTPLRMRAGFNEVELVLRQVVLGESIEQPVIQPMTILRHWSETVVLPSDAGKVM